MLSKWRRRLRGALRMGVAWGLAWFGVGMIILAIVGPDAADVPFPLGFGMLGFFMGVTFSAILSVVAGRRTFSEISLPKFTGWGAAGGGLFALLFVVAAAIGGNTLDPLFLVPFFSAIGAVCAAGSLALARMAEDRDLLGAGQDDEIEAKQVGRLPSDD